MARSDHVKSDFEMRMLDASALATEAVQGALPETLMSDADGKLLKEGLRSLERRIQPAPGPTIPDSVGIGQTPSTNPTTTPSWIKSVVGPTPRMCLKPSW